MSGSHTRRWRRFATRKDPARIHALVGAWYAESGRVLGRAYHEWFDPAVDELAEALVTGRDADDAAVRLGTARAHAGFDFEDALADWSVLLAHLPSRVRTRVDEPLLTAALTAGFDSVGPESFPPATELGSASDLRRQLARLYRRHHEAGVHPADTHALLLVDLEAHEAGDADQAGALHSVAVLLRSHFPTVGDIGCLGRSRFAVLAHRHPGLAVSVDTLRTALRSAPALAGTEVSLWLAPLPASISALPRFVRRLVLDPAPAWSLGHAVADDGSDLLSAHLAETPRATAPVRRAPPARRLRVALAAAWNGGLSLVVAALAVVVLATGVVRAVGPAGEASQATGTTFRFLQGLPVPASAPEAATVPVEVAPEPVTGTTVPEAAPARVVRALPAPPADEPLPVSVSPDPAEVAETVEPERSRSGDIPKIGPLDETVVERPGNSEKAAGRPGSSGKSGASTGKGSASVTSRGQSKGPQH